MPVSAEVLETLPKPRQHDDASRAVITPKQREFVRLWASGETVNTASYKVWGPGAKTGYQIYKRPAIRELYEIEKRKYEEASQMSRKKVMDGLLESIEMAKLMAEPASMIAGWREIGKMCGYYEPVQRRIDVNISGNVVMERLNRLSDAELLKLIQQEVTHAVEDDSAGDEDE
jgi:phage terminase small subunit